MSRQSIIIVHHDTLGLAHDARVLISAIKRTFKNPAIRLLVLPGEFVDNYSAELSLPDYISDLKPFDYMFLLEHAHANPPLFSPSFAKRIIYIPNIEWINQKDEDVIATGQIDMVMLKNNFSFNTFVRLPVSSMVGTIELTGWTSDDIRDAKIAFGKKDFNSFLHVRGISSQKQTEVVMETWCRHPTFPTLTVVLRFYGGFELSQPLRYAENVSIILQDMPSIKLRRMQNLAGIHVCPSKREGFGHSLNEARAAASALITTNGPPMNELVRHGENGLLIPVDLANVSSVRRSLQFDITAERLGEQVDHLLSLSLQRRQDMGRMSRVRFLSERDKFFERFAICRDIG